MRIHTNIESFSAYEVVRQADPVISSSTQSTLGWVCGSGKPYLYLDFKWSPGRIIGQHLNFYSIDGLISAVIPDPGQIYGPKVINLAEMLMC